MKTPMPWWWFGLCYFMYAWCGFCVGFAWFHAPTWLAVVATVVHAYLWWQTFVTKSKATLERRKP